ncbi:aldehyde dehydrogenase (NADP(+)) [Marinobacterium lacunae]|uniref:aldehyde dehydrogenase (NADP(+)) n=1 Tax=Marinobacterium lacunae TaxID=1232683 RepID=UPI00056B1BC3|nr:aldehyde dehydrogenase (NADP(+)) [Marinobacterium lacunae]
MELSGKNLIGQNEVLGTQAKIQATNPATNEVLAPAYPGVTAQVVNEACSLAWSAFRHYRNTTPQARAQFLDCIAEQIEALGDQLIERAMQETGLPRARLEGERGRTCNQLRLFAGVVRDGTYLDVRIDPALPERKPLPRSDLRFRRLALGPVAVFGASNFPLAFSVAGGDTASALAAGCPVVVKAHSAHPGTSELVGRAVQQAARACAMPEGVFSLLYGAGNEIGTALVAHPQIKAVGFTGSRRGGVALMQVAQNRAEPIPVYAEMSSINPVYLLPGALTERAEAIAAAFVAAQQMGAGQFCTSPGLILAVDGPELEQFLAQASQQLADTGCQTMLTPGIHRAFEQGLAVLEQHPAVTTLARAQTAVGPNQCRAGLFVARAADFLNDERLAGEVFGSCTLVLRCADAEEMLQVTQALEGQLTAAVHCAEVDATLAKQLIEELELKAGRVLFNGFGTGVEVCQAMVHGGPFPATSDSRTSSVGASAIERFLRPVCYQDVPDALLPAELQQANPLQMPRRVDGQQ